MHTSGDRMSWLNAVAAAIMDGGSSPPSIDRLNLIVPGIIVTAQNDGHVTAAAAFGEDRRNDWSAGCRVIISEMIGLLREQGFVGGSDQGLTWIKPIDGTWKVSTPDGRNFTVFGQRERRMSRDRSILGERDEIEGNRIGPPGLIESRTGDGHSRMQPLELLVEGARGNIKVHKFDIHPLASLMPSYTEAERERLRADIERNGIKMPIVIYQKKILDGRNRGYFGSILKKPVRITEFEGTEEEARRHVISLNLVRRHLSSAQQQLLAFQLFGEEAKKEAAEVRKEKVGRPKKGATIPAGNCGEKFATISNADDVGRWEEIAARKAKEAGLTSATPDGIRAMANVVAAPNTLADVESGKIQRPARAASLAREELGMGKATTFEGTYPRSANKHLGEIIGHFKSLLNDSKIEHGDTTKLKERSREIRRLHDEFDKGFN